MTPTRTSSPSATAIHNAILIRFARSFIATGRNLPRRPRDEALPEALETACGLFRVFPVAEEAVQRRPSAGDVGAEGAELAEPLCESRRCEVVRRQRREVACLQLSEQIGAPLFESLGAVETRVPRRRRLLRLAARNEQEHRVVARHVDALERRAVARRE